MARMAWWTAVRSFWRSPSAAAAAMICAVDRSTSRFDAAYRDNSWCTAAPRLMSWAIVRLAITSRTSLPLMVEVKRNPIGPFSRL